MTAETGAPFRRLAADGWLAGLGALVLGGLLARLPAPHLADLLRPLAWIGAPARDAWLSDRDLALLGYLLLEAALVLAAWTYFALALARTAALRLSGAPAPSRRGALSFARRHLPAAFGARAGAVLALALPPVLALVVVGASGPRGAIRSPIVLDVLLLLLLAAWLFAAWRVFVGGFALVLAVAVEGCSGFEAVDRALTWARERPREVLALRVRALGPRLVAALRASILALGIAIVLVFLLRAVAGGAGFTRALAVLEATGRPPDAARLGSSSLDVALAGALVAVLAMAALRVLAAFSSAVALARADAYLALRARIDRVGPSYVVASPDPWRHRDAEEAGFRLVGRVE